MVPIENIAEIADKFTRNEIMTSNEIRQVVGLAPHPDPKADKLVNSNMPQGSPTPTGITPDNPTGNTPSGDNPGIDAMASSFDEIDAAINEAMASLSTNGGGS